MVAQTSKKLGIVLLTCSWMRIEPQGGEYSYLSIYRCEDTLFVLLIVMNHCLPYEDIDHFDDPTCACHALFNMLSAPLWASYSTTVYTDRGNENTLRAL